MIYRTLNISSHTNQGFERFRWHGINYILRQGEVLERSSLEPGRMRHNYNEEEFGLVTFDSGFYFFYVEPSETGKSRNLRVVVADSDELEVDKRVSELSSILE